MASIINFDRDLDYLKLNQSYVPLSLEQSWTNNPDLNVTSDGITYEQDASFNHYQIAQPALNITQYYARAAGLHMIGPDITDGSPYRIRGYLFEASGIYHIFCMYGVGPAAPSTIAAGNQIIGCTPIVCGSSFLKLDETVYIPSFESQYPGGGYSERPITFYCMLYRYDNAPLNTIFHFRLSVQRLGVKPPNYKTANK